VLHVAGLGGATAEGGSDDSLVQPEGAQNK